MTQQWSVSDPDGVEDWDSLNAVQQKGQQKGQPKANQKRDGGFDQDMKKTLIQNK